MSEVIVTKQILTSSIVKFITKYSGETDINSTQLLMGLNNLEMFQDTEVIELYYDNNTVLNDILDHADIDIFSRPGKLLARVDGEYVIVLKDSTNPELLSILNEELVGFKIKK